VFLPVGLRVEELLPVRCHGREQLPAPLDSLVGEVRAARDLHGRLIGFRSQPGQQFLLTALAQQPFQVVAGLSAVGGHGGAPWDFTRIGDRTRSPGVGGVRESVTGASHLTASDTTTQQPAWRSRRWSMSSALAKLNYCGKVGRARRSRLAERVDPTPDARGKTLGRNDDPLDTFPSGHYCYTFQNFGVHGVATQEWFLGGQHDQSYPHPHGGVRPRGPGPD